MPHHWRQGPLDRIGRVIGTGNRSHMVLIALRRRRPSIGFTSQVMCLSLPALLSISSIKESRRDTSALLVISLSKRVHDAAAQGKSSGPRCDLGVVEVQPVTHAASSGDARGLTRVAIPGQWPDHERVRRGGDTLSSVLGLARAQSERRNTDDMGRTAHGS